MCEALKNQGGRGGSEWANTAQGGYFPIAQISEDIPLSLACLIVVLLCSFSPWLLDLCTASSALAVNGLFIVHLNYDAVVIHHTSFNRLDHIVCLCFHTVVTDKSEEDVEPDLE